MTIPHSRPFIDKDDIMAVSAVLASGQIAQGKKLKEFEDAVAAFIGTKYAVAVSSGTAALYLALRALQIGYDHEIIVPSYVCSSPFWAIKLIGAQPKIVDIDLSDFNISASEVKKNITPKTKAVIVPHMFGCPAEIDELIDIGIPIIEDCAQALGAEFKNRKVGSFGTISVFSFYATKMITTGEGGMILTNNQRLVERIKEIRDYDKRSLEILRFNFKMTDLQAALGISQMKKLKNFIEKRRRTASLYSKNFKSSMLRLPVEAANRKSTYYRYVVLTKERKSLQEFARIRDISCERPVWKPLHRYFKTTGYPNSDFAYKYALSIPIYPRLTQMEKKYLIREIALILRRLARNDRFNLRNRYSV
ncbi:MAG: DegT/DnrJ/EryC1/StrS family aminotransferase [Clostridiales bacterium]|nr:DegT/DnrJ/EryC1/StrS family aminotransferase [Clostridiales bacterium]